MSIDADRVWNQEGAFTWRSNSLNDLLKELDAKIEGNECYINITRTSNLISQIDYYSDLARTDKVAQRVFTRTNGKITQVVSTFYNVDTSVDSTITATITRDVNGRITSCDSAFSTTEDTGC